MRKMRKRERKILAFLVAVVIAVSLVAILLLTPAFNINKIKVHGNSVLKDEQIIKLSGIAKGENIFSVSLKNAKDNIKSHGYVENVKIKRSLPSTIDIGVVEEVGVAYLVAKKGFVIITAEGRCIEITDGTTKNNVVKTPDFPLIKGLKKPTYELGKKIKSENEAQLESLLECLHEFSKYGYIFDIREIDVKDVTNIKFYYTSKDFCVTIGTTDKLGYKLECMGSILEKLDSPPTGHLNLKHENPVYTPLEKEVKKEKEQ